MCAKKFDYNICEDDVQMLRALAHPLRLRLVKELMNRGTCNVTQLQEALQIPQSTVSQHLTKLKQTKVVQFQRRGLEVYYKVQDDKVNHVMGTLFT
ncbi:metalloregulator ArsR/SmtB family transcription factor [Ectobacillus antri]|uniref:Metalloregulator ArsR/SmtB family transcription factor n=1 Tax=Ectobacillus antri TaxID=2486280 RepID=A0ABT6H6X9_9BACI|nr:metalloregulator ArsR/SmtB family transcription factor [Ectobacillus antri]MDG4657395.1 metalloregulator ArsR/SmtB family transcription factor [Ectobacillus antri]MDG5754474.1 metalloregulator ArsR/SmtB family transcription factor [Ectobacillus antri]